MASSQAIGSVAEAVARLLRQSWQPMLPGGIEPQFAVYQGKDFSSPMDAGLSVFVYQVGVDRVQRTLPPADASHRRPLPVDIAFLLTPWAQDVSAEHDLLGWAMRTIADNPILSSGFLNAAVAGVFRPEETVDGTPAAWSVVAVDTGADIYLTLADEQGRFLRYLPYPEALPPLAGSLPVGPGLGAVQWPLTVTVKTDGTAHCAYRRQWGEAASFTQVRPRG